MASPVNPGFEKIWPRMRARARREGIPLLAAACLPEPAQGLPSAVSIAAPLSREIVAQIPAGPAPTMAYYHHYRTANALLDRAAFLMAAFLQAQGFCALPIPASQTVDREAQAASFPHKTAAVLGGLGWIGRHDLLITPEYGPRIRLATVLTNLPVPANTPVSDAGCGACRLCVSACPAGAIKGGSWSPGTSRADLVDAHACLAYMRVHFDRVGRGSVCGICMAVCPGK